MIAIPLRLVAAAGLTVVVAVGCGPIGGDVPADVYQLGSFRPATDAETAEAISREEAVAAAGWIPSSGRPEPDAYLGFFGSGTLTGLVWLIRWDNVDWDKPPPTAPGSVDTTPVPYRYEYVFIDARTGEYLMSQYRV